MRLIKFRICYAFLKNLGHSIQEAEMNAAALALEESGNLFPQLHHQKSVVDKTTKWRRTRTR